MKRMPLSPLTLKDLMRYCPQTGVFIWVKPANSRMCGRRAGTVNSSGRRQIKIGDKFYKEHRLAWLYVYGEFPKGDLDHIDRNPLNNRISNLRLATKSQNSLNRGKPRHCSNPVKGVRFIAEKGKWRSYGNFQKKSVHIGYFDDLELAALVSSEFRDKYHGNFACHK